MTSIDLCICSRWCTQKGWPGPWKQCRLGPCSCQRSLEAVSFVGLKVLLLWTSLLNRFTVGHTSQSDPSSGMFGSHCFACEGVKEGHRMRANRRAVFTLTHMRTGHLGPSHTFPSPHEHAWDCTAPPWAQVAHTTHFSQWNVSKILQVLVSHLLQQLVTQWSWGHLKLGTLREGRLSWSALYICCEQEISVVMSAHWDSGIIYKFGQWDNLVTKNLSSF